MSSWLREEKKTASRPTAPGASAPVPATCPERTVDGGGSLGATDLFTLLGDTPPGGPLLGDPSRGGVAHPDSPHGDTLPCGGDLHGAERVTADGAAWLASAGPYPRATLALWAEHPGAPGVLPCGTAFDVVNLPTVFGRRVLDRLWAEGPGCGPVAVHRGRMHLFAAPGTAQRLPALLGWEEWGTGDDGGRRPGVPPLLCHGAGDAVTVPPLARETPGAPRWLVAPDTRRPWLPGPEVLLWACVGAARAAEGADGTHTVPAARRRPAPSPSSADFSSRGSGC